jgi:predicted AlkP superfamily phosphohydrolase/phosphomutase
MAPTQSLPGQVIFYLRSVRPNVEIYASPVNIDPLDQALPVSTPKGYAAELAEATGRFYTQGAPEEAEAVVDRTISRDEFLDQARIVQDELDSQFHHVLGDFDTGLLFYYFGYTDQVAHMVWRSMDPGHPTYDPKEDLPYVDVVPKLYERADGIVGEALSRVGKDGNVIVMSDHGFTSWRRGFNLNTWLEREGYIVLAGPPKAGTASSLNTNVDWSRTRAYSIGLADLYINVAGREGAGIVPRAEKDNLVREIASKLRHVVDPATGERVVRRVFVTDEEFHDGEYLDIGPDGVLGYHRYHRGSWESANGTLDPAVLKDNVDWTGDHVVDPVLVPGILFSSQRLGRRVTGLKDLGAAILAEFGVEGFPA